MLPRTPTPDPWRGCTILEARKCGVRAPIIANSFEKRRVFAMWCGPDHGSSWRMKESSTARSPFGRAMVLCSLISLVVKFRFRVHRKGCDGRQSTSPLSRCIHTIERPLGSVSAALSGSNVGGQSVDLCRHDEVVPVQPMNLMRPQVHRHTPPLGEDRRMMTFNLSESPDAVRET